MSAVTLEDSIRGFQGCDSVFASCVRLSSASALQIASALSSYSVKSPSYGSGIFHFTWRSWVTPSVRTTCAISFVCLSSMLTTRSKCCRSVLRTSCGMCPLASMPNVERSVCTALAASPRCCGLMPAEAIWALGPRILRKRARPKYSAIRLRHVFPVHTKRMPCDNTIAGFHRSAPSCSARGSAPFFLAAVVFGVVECGEELVLRFCAQAVFEVDDAVDHLPAVVHCVAKQLSCLVGMVTRRT